MSLISQGITPFLPISLGAISGDVYFNSLDVDSSNNILIGGSMSSSPLALYMESTGSIQWAYQFTSIALTYTKVTEVSYSHPQLKLYWYLITSLRF